jgi:hypothetical protein
VVVAAACCVCCDDAEVSEVVSSGCEVVAVVVVSCEAEVLVVVSDVVMLSLCELVFCSELSGFDEDVLFDELSEQPASIAAHIARTDRITAAVRFVLFIFSPLTFVF